MKKLVHRVLFGSWLYTLGFGSFLPIIAAYQGVLLGVTVIGIVTIVRQLVIELLPLLKKYKYKNLYLAEVIYTSGYGAVITMLVVFNCSLEMIAAVGCIGFIPYGLLKAIDNKFNTMVAEYYTPKILEAIRFREAVIESRASIIAIAVTSGIAYYDPKSIIPVIVSVFIITIANLWSWYIYIDNIRKLRN